MDPNVRVRFAPSPTGYLHIGGARTALFNWLWARKNQGTFVLRIEDTDQDRSTEDSVRVIFEAMEWLGLDWDEGPVVGGPHGPYFQMRRLEIYQDFAERLIKAGGAYRCYCTKEELDAQRAKLPEKKRDRWVYPGTCRDRTDEPDLPWVLRQRVHGEGEVLLDDLVYGAIRTPISALQDQVLMRANGVPLYNFGAAVDDITMGINLVARGSDHIVNTPSQILIYRDLDAPLPRFAHLPMMLTPDGKKMSKRLGEQQGIDVPVEKYREKGWLPDALLNYIARFGWSQGDQEIFTRAELIEKFDWAQVGSGDGRFDKKKSAWVSGEHLRALSDAALAAGVVPFLAARGLTVAPDDAKLLAAVKTVRPRSTTWVDMAEALDFYFRDEITLDPAAAQKFLNEGSRAQLAAIADVLDPLDDYSEAGITAALDAWLSAQGLEIKHVAQPARVALTGRAASPGIYEVLAVLGRERAVARLRAASVA